ncbi:hypothetical protein [Alicyclobacillus ferrooxydans]|uniref:Flagellar protein n=1 Tax=Alicyclobacillus ferrooxydans TaxID=471514 RepID=A0A0N8PP05_9BACL|nr:hypothetical protein [Alicyclobacillus ferrooxydans]KPV42981.1 hypothetical protein AN477_15030 [Alicyclobacillus ferrooxydans]
MPIARCKRCQRIFNKTRRDICPTCIAAEDDAFQIVRGYLKEHPDSDMDELTVGTAVQSEVVIGLIQDGRLIPRDNPNLTYPCARCGKPTQAGHYCAKCTKEIMQERSAARKKPRVEL